uniref:Helicase, lymphoid specific n=1 Tax=Pavo cristatus TaxID=9049 RepID=A0A8C9F6J5_PAVCR
MWRAAAVSVGPRAGASGGPGPGIIARVVVAEPPGAEMGEQEMVITPAMLAEEEQLEAAGLEKERQMLEKARSAWDRESSEMRYKRLQHLLEKSNIYSKFLLTKMEQQQLEVRVFLSTIGILKMSCHLLGFLAT